MKSLLVQGHAVVILPVHSAQVAKQRGMLQTAESSFHYAGTLQHRMISQVRSLLYYYRNSHACNHHMAGTDILSLIILG